MTRNNLLSLIEDSARFGGDAAVVKRQGYRRRSLTYGEVRELGRAWRERLAAEGVTAGDRVVLWGANSGEWVGCFWGALLQGAIAVPLDAGSTEDFAGHVIRECGARLVVCDAGLARPEGVPSMLFDEVRAEEREIPRYEGFARNDGERDRGDERANENEEGRPGRDDQRAANEEDGTRWQRSTGQNDGRNDGRDQIAEILFTSGTTGTPRGVVLSHGNFLANLEPIERGIQPYLKYERFLHPLKFVSLVPLSHVFGQFMALFVPPLLGATVVLENSANPAEILKTIKRERATLLIAVPRMLELVRGAVEREIDARGWRKWFDKNFAAAAKTPFLRRAWRFRRIHRLFGARFWAFISGGAALGAETERFFKRLGFAVVQGYGMTETASLISLNHPFSAAEGSVGRILPGREFKLAKDGEILVRGENVSQGYWREGGLQGGGQPEGGWLHTGDMGELDEQGNLKFRGRKKNVIVTAAGLNIYPEDLEAELKKEAAIRDAVVVALEQDGNAQAFAVLLMNEVKEVEDGKEANDRARASVDAANVRLAEFQKMRKWMVWKDVDLPRTATGKPRLAVIAAAARKEDGEKAGTTDGATGEQKDDDPLERLGAAGLTALSSLDRVELLSALEQRYGVEINEERFSRAESAGDLRKLVDESISRRGRSGTAGLRDEYRYPAWAQWDAVRWLRLTVYYALVWPATQILGHPKIFGREKLGGVKGPCIVISNHITRRADMGLILLALPARLRHRLATAMGGETLVRMQSSPREWFFLKRWSYWMGYWLVTALFNVFPLPQFSGFRESFRFAGESADRGYSVLIFPEGEVNNSGDGRLARFQPGIGLLAENLRLPIVPMRLDGVWQMKKEGRRLADLGEIKVHIGEPVKFAAGTPPEEIAKRLEILVDGL
jgi:long-chain acyl-CoA synthetase